MAFALVLLLAVLQGLTEFLPVSSDGHLRLLQAVAGVSAPATAVDVALHLGTLGAVVFVLRRELGDVLRGALGLCGALLRGEPRAAWRRPEVRLGVYLCVATVPTGLVGLLLGQIAAGPLGGPLWVAGWLLLNGGVLWLAGPLGRRAAAAGPPRELADLRLRDALVIGAVQGTAVLRGLSRSGATIVAGLALGLSRDAAARFSFLASVPAILAAATYEGLFAAPEPGTPGLATLGLGVVLAAVVGFGALRLLLRIVRTGRIERFAYYCWALAAVVMVAALAGWM